MSITKDHLAGLGAVAVRASHIELLQEHLTKTLLSPVEAAIWAPVLGPRPKFDATQKLARALVKARFGASNSPNLDPRAHAAYAWMDDARTLIDRRNGYLHRSWAGVDTGGVGALDPASPELVHLTLEELMTFEVDAATLESRFAPVCQEMHEFVVARLAHLVKSMVPEVDPG